MIKINGSLKILMWGAGAIFAAGGTWAGYNTLNAKVLKLEATVEKHIIIIAKIEPTLIFLVDSIKRIDENTEYLRRREDKKRMEDD